MGSYNKPLISEVSGEIRGGAASIWSQLPFTVADHPNWKLHETSLGYIPDCGASYYLPRIPGELGLYLALTG